MRMVAGIAAAATLAAGLSAFADPQPRYDMTGRVCTAAEVASRPIVKVNYGGRILKMRMDCRTAGEWRAYRLDAAEKDRQQARDNQRRMATPNFSSSPNFQSGSE